jgi:putative photosynthetic complex assembly protein
MNESSHHESFPRVPLLGAAALIAFALSVVTASQLHKLEAPLKADAGASTVAERELRFEDRSDGSITVIDARQGRLVDTVAPGTNGFLRGTLRGLARERKREGLDGTVPFRLSQTRAGHLLLTDPATGRFVDLGSFGPTNAAVFARLLTADEVMASPLADSRGANHS